MSKWTKRYLGKASGEANGASLYSYRRFLPSLPGRSIGRGKTKAEPAVVRFLEEWEGMLDGISRAQAVTFAKHVEVVRVKSGNYLCKMDHVADCVYIVYKGVLNSQEPVKNESKMRTTEEFNVRDLIGCLSFMLAVPWGANVVAVTDTIVLKLEREAYHKLKSMVFMGKLNRRLATEKTEHVIGSLKKCALLSHVPEEELAHVAELFEAMYVRQGATLCRTGEPAEMFYFVSTGEMLQSEMDETKQFEIEVGRLGPGVTIGENALVQEDAKYEGNILAVRDCLLFSLHSKCMALKG